VAVFYCVFLYSVYLVICYDFMRLAFMDFVQIALALRPRVLSFLAAQRGHLLPWPWPGRAAVSAYVRRCSIGSLLLLGNAVWFKSCRRSRILTLYSAEVSVNMSSRSLRCPWLVLIVCSCLCQLSLGEWICAAVALLSRFADFIRQ